MAHMIVLLQPKDKKWFIQIGHTDKFETFNLNFEDNGSVSILKGFSIPTLCYYPTFNVFGDRDTKTIAHVVKVLPKMLEDVCNVGQFIDRLARRFKVKGYQINVNSDFDWSNLQPWNSSSPYVIVKDLQRAGLSVNL